MSAYVKQPSTRSRCNHCKQPVELVVREDADIGSSHPAFWICWKCKRIWHIGEAEVKEAGKLS